jgi:hypothetical protein
MSETAAETTAPAQEQPADATTEPPKDDGTDWKAEARKWEQRAKDNSGAAKAAEKARLESLTEQERAIEEAKQSARAEATTQFGSRLAQTEVRAQAADAGADLSGVFDYLDLTRFVGDDGEPDTKAIKSFVEGLPKKSVSVPGLDLGARTTAPADGDMNQALRRALGRS